MSDEPATSPEPGGLSREEMLTAIFAQFVLQQTRMATMMLGKIPHPETGQTVKELDVARMFIDQLEMLEAKTRGNLTKEEQALLKQSLMSLHLAYVEAADSAPPAPAGPAPANPPGPTESADEAPGNQPAPESSAPDLESKKKFSKKY